MTHVGRVPPGLDVTKPNVARVYDAFLDGKDNFAADRQVVDFALQVTPDAPVGARANRAFLRRVVRYLTADAGIRQLVDIGSGLRPVAEGRTRRDATYYGFVGGVARKPL